MKNITTSINTLKAERLTVDHTVQRALNERRVETMVLEFNEDALGVLTVSDRGDGTYHIVDGQHRWAAATKFGVSYVQCKVYKGLAREDEAALFRVLNDTKIVNALDRFRVRVVEKEPVAVDIFGILDKTGWRIPVHASNRSSGVINSPVALEWVYKGAAIRSTRQPNILRQTIEVITAAWGYDADGMRSDVVRGVGAFLTRYEGILDLTKVVRMLTQYPGGPLKLQADGTIIRSMRSTTAPDSVASILTDLYNRKRSVHRLPEWFVTSRIRPQATDTDEDTEEDSD
jgi:hypothetical protein